VFDLNDLLDDLAARIAGKLNTPRDDSTEAASPWLDTAEAAAYCRMTAEGIRGAEKRQQLRAHRSETGRVRFLRDDLDRFLGIEAA
jgi:hypothetical protein